MHEHDEYSHSEIINRCNFGSRHLINARLSSQTCLQHQADSSAHDATSQCLHSKDIDDDHGSDETIKYLLHYVKIDSWVLVDSVNYNDLYIDSDEDEDTSLTSSFVNKNDKEHGKKKRNLNTNITKNCTKSGKA